MARQQVEETLRGLITEGVSKIGGTVEDCIAVCLGTAGVDRQEEKNIMESIIKSTGYRGKTIITNDAVTALYGGVGSGEGIIIISGTGSICYGRNSKGEVFRTGGWGHIIGDEGSGYDIGVKALRHIMRSFDGREGETLMASMILGHLNIKSPEGLVPYIYRSGAGKKEIAGLAKIVDEAYLSGDSAALNILKEAAFELYLCCKTVVERLDLNYKPVTIAVNGSVLTKNKYIFNEYFQVIGCLSLR
jgi:N-acetylglucosamine kinase-like BadF-type ATPase